MRTDKNVDLAFAHLLEDFLLFLRALVAVHESDAHAKARKAVHKVLIMLRRQNRRRHQKNHLLFVHHALERRTHGNFSLAKAHIATNQAIHRTTRFHIALDIFGSLHLVGRRIIFKVVFKIFL